MTMQVGMRFGNNRESWQIGQSLDRRNILDMSELYEMFNLFMETIKWESKR
jgi:hypothetical protein